MPDDITSRLKRWTHDVSAVSASDLMDEAASEIERLRQHRNYWMETARAFDEHLATMRVMLLEQPGVRFGAVESRETVRQVYSQKNLTLTDEEREAIRQYWIKRGYDV